MKTLHHYNTCVVSYLAYSHRNKYTLLLLAMASYLPNANFS